jgi:FixJ family two-component response regulator
MVVDKMTLGRIALVDDEASVRVALGRVLRLADYDVVAFASGEDFLAAFDETRLDCALLDVHLPGLTGIEVQKRLRSSHVRLPVVFITASEDPTVEREALSAGGFAVLRKPFTRHELLASLVSALELAADTTSARRINAPISTKR